ncbi:MAG: hypothetical protein JWQ87_5136 [Candidatus Sulfotelmatobacter sp.]|nr:hypothetical protein [Candidatus Sulfotelmatobacter sp.]
MVKEILRTRPLFHEVTLLQEIKTRAWHTGSMGGEDRIGHTGRFRRGFYVVSTEDVRAFQN